jgi:hypothetical protein
MSKLSHNLLKKWKEKLVTGGAVVGPREVILILVLIVAVAFVFRNQISDTIAESQKAPGNYYDNMGFDSYRY